MMTQAVMDFLQNGGGGESTRTLVSEKFILTWQTFYNVLIPTFLNYDYLVKAFWIVFLSLGGVFLYQQRKYDFKTLDYPFLIAIMIIVIPFIGYTFLPVQVNSWHLVCVVAAVIVLIAFTLSQLSKYKFVGWPIIAVFGVFCLVTVSTTVYKDLFNTKDISDDPSNLRNELNAIDFAYQHAQGKNFKAYAYLPSVIDYPYQYLFWWYGLKKYGYTPADYAYLPNKPAYISNKDAFNFPLVNGDNSGLVFLIKEPDRIKMRGAWEGELLQFEKISIDTLGPLEVETRQE